MVANRITNVTYSSSKLYTVYVYRVAHLLSSMSKVMLMKLNKEAGIYNFSGFGSESYNCL